MKKKSILVLMLIFTLVLVSSCAKTEAPVEKEEIEDVVEDPVEDEVADEPEEESDKLDFGGRTMNVVTTSEKYIELFDAFGEEVNAKVEFLSMSSGEVIARIEAEGGTPMAEIGRAHV